MLKDILQYGTERHQFRRIVHLMNIGAKIIGIYHGCIVGETIRSGLGPDGVQHLVFVTQSGASFSFKYEDDVFKIFPLKGRPGLFGYQLSWFPTKTIWEKH